MVSSPHPFTANIRGKTVHDDLTKVLLLEDRLATGRTKPDLIPLRRRPELAGTYVGDFAPNTPSDHDGTEVRKMDAARSVRRWYIQGKCDLEELLLHLYFGHLSVSAVDSIVDGLWGKSGGAMLVSEMIPGLLMRLNGWLRRPIRKKFSNIFVQAVDTRPRRALGAPPVRLIMVGGIDAQSEYHVLGITASTFETGRFWDSAVAQLASRGLACPEVIVSDLKEFGGSRAINHWTGFKLLPFCSEFDQALRQGLAYLDRELMEPLIVRLRKSSNPTEARLNGSHIFRQLENSGYSELKQTLDEKFRHYLVYFEIPVNFRANIYRAEKMRVALANVRERARIIGPIVDDQVLVWLAAAAFRRLSRATLFAEPISRSKRAPKNSL